MNTKEFVNLDKLIGLNKKEILEILGDEFNISYAKEWQYELKKKSIFNKILILYFDEYDRVKTYKQKKYLNI